MYGSARARYLDVDVTSRIEGASPHRLVAILFEELDKAVDAMGVALTQGETGRIFTAQSRALTILHGLETSLDHQRGGEIAPGLAAIYREARRLLRAASRASDPKRAEQARDMLRAIAGAWTAIG
jgi:flagellar secretion chaperone FliS